MHTFANTNELITAALLQLWTKMPKLAVNGEKKGGSLQKRPRNNYTDSRMVSKKSYNYSKKQSLITFTISKIKLTSISTRAYKIVVKKCHSILYQLITVHTFYGV